MHKKKCWLTKIKTLHLDRLQKILTEKVKAVNIFLSVFSVHFMGYVL